MFQAFEFKTHFLLSVFFFVEFYVAAFHTVLASVSDIFSFACPPDLVTVLFHKFKEVVLVFALLHRRVNYKHQFKFPVRAFFGSTKFALFKFRRRVVIIRLKNFYTVLLSDFIAQFSQVLERLRTLTEPLASFKIYRVDNEMIVNMSSVNMSSN